MEKCIRTENAFRAFRNNERARRQVVAQDTLQNPAKVRPISGVLFGLFATFREETRRYAAFKGSKREEIARVANRKQTLVYQGLFVSKFDTKVLSSAVRPHD